MRFRRLGVVAFALALLVLPTGATAKDPPNPNDPCSSAGRDTCGTTGVGFYSDSPYGIRWFGDYRGAVGGQAQTFCIDLGYWYPSPRYAFREAPVETLRNRESEVVPLVNTQRMAYAIWAYGRTNDRNRQAAVMLYVHSLMGDARPREVDPAGVDAALVPIVAQIARDAARLHGPYRIAAQLPGSLVPGREATATVRVLSAVGVPVPDLALTVTAEGATVAGSVRTNAEGVATVKLTPAGGAEVQLNVRGTLAATLPRLFAPTAGPAVRNGQRLVAPDSEVVSKAFAAPVAKARIAVASSATPASVLVGEASRDRITIRGPLHGTVTWNAYGPFPTPGAIRCNGTPAARGSFEADGAGVYMTAPATFERPGLYVYKETIAETAAHVGVATPCTDPGERVRVEVQPRVRTVVSSDRVEPGTQISDRLVVDGLAGQSATVTASLYGPYPAADAIDCTGTPFWTGSIRVPKDGEYTTPSVALTEPGFYVYRESIAAEGFVRAVQTPCAEQAETTVAVARPKIATRVSAQAARPGARISDRVVVTGLGAIAAPVSVKLWGPFTRRGGISCSGAPYWSSSFTAKGNGTYTTEPVELKRAGYYTYQESIPVGPASSAFTAPCGEVGETTIVRAAPRAVTIASAEVVLPGTALFDRIRVGGLVETDAAIDVELFGPFASRAAVRCAGQPLWRGRVYAAGDGVVRSPKVRVARVGFYTFRERIAGTPLVDGSTTECPLDVETALARPQIVTGRGDVTRAIRARGAGALTPARVRLASLGIDAPVSPVGIDVPHGVLGVSANIHRTAWWADGAAPGSGAGSILIAGHVDSAVAGPGAFFRLREARRGDRIELRTAGERTLAYRVVSVRSYLKRLLPADVYSRHGRPRLVLVTCGGPFDQASGHYRDNIVVTAVPA